MSSHVWPTIEISKVSSLWFRPLQAVREEFSLTRLEEMLDQTRRCYMEKGINLAYHGKAEIENGDDDDDADEAEEESEADDEMDAQQGPGSPGTAVGVPPTALDA